MAHFTASRSKRGSTPPEWLRIGGQIANVTNKLSSREDIIVYCGPGAGEGAPACFKPTIAEMEIDVEKCFGEKANPRFIPALDKRRNQFDYPVPMGAITHEAAHAEWSLWSLDEHAKHKDYFERELVTLFEESRVETLAVVKHPKNRAFLRACALTIVMADVDPDKTSASGSFALAQLLLLTLARVDAGVLNKDDVKLVAVKGEEVFGEDLMKALRKVWRTAQRHAAHSEWKPLLELAKEFLKLMKDAGFDPYEEIKHAAGTPGAGGAGAAAAGAIMEAMEDMAEETETKAEAEATATMVAEKREEEAAEKAAARAEERTHTKKAETIFKKHSGPAGVYGTGSRLDIERDPTPKERAAANTVGGMLEKAKYHDRVITKSMVEMPPGKLNGAAAMQADAERSAGVMVTQRPWQTKRRHHTQDPTLKVGIMVDISGSMSSAMEPMGVTAWVFSEAVRRIQGEAAMVYYGGAVFPVLRKGQSLDKVRIYSAPDGTEEFDDAFQALDGELNMLYGTGARLLVIVSDCQYREDQEPLLRKWLNRCTEAGVGVIIIPFHRSHLAKDYTEITGVKVMTGVSDPTAVATQIGAMAAEALEIAGGKR